VPPGTVIDGKYRVERVLGEGGMGVVYVARAITTEVDVVLKAVRPEIAHRQDVRQRTLAEGRALARIDHPNVVQLKSVVTGGDQLWLVMQYIEGESLEDTIVRHAQARTPMAVGEVLRIFRQVVAGVGAAHDEGVIHRDLKPANILIRAKDGVVKVTDFGIAKPEEDARAGRGETKGIIGSFHYMSPEQVMGRRDLDRRVDIYALGIVLYEMLVGAPPFTADNTFDILRQQVELPMPDPRTYRADVPAALCAVIERACAKDREQRYSSCAQLAAALEGIERQSGVAPTQYQPPAPAAALPAVSQAAYAKTVQPFAAPAQLAPAPGAPAMTPTPQFGTLTAQPATVAPHRGRGGSWWIAIPVLALLVLGGGTVLLMSAMGDHTSDGDSDETEETDEGPAVHPKPSAEPTPLGRLEGGWVSDSGRRLRAVVVGSAVEFQVVDASQFSAQGYHVGEARFVLRPVEGARDAFVVEDRIRPVPPTGHHYDSANARSTCLASWTQADGRPLGAVLNAGRLDVEFAKIEPTVRNFDLSGRSVLSCRGLEKLPATRLPVVFRRP